MLGLRRLCRLRLGVSRLVTGAANISRPFKGRIQTGAFQKMLSDWSVLGLMRHALSISTNFLHASTVSRVLDSGQGGLGYERVAATFLAAWVKASTRAKRSVGAVALAESWGGFGGGD